MYTWHSAVKTSDVSLEGRLSCAAFYCLGTLWELERDIEDSPGRDMLKDHAMSMEH